MFVSGPKGAQYGAAVTTGLVGKDERNGRINPALDINDDEVDTAKAAALQRKASIVGKVYKQGYEQTTGF